MSNRLKLKFYEERGETRQLGKDWDKFVKVATDGVGNDDNVPAAMLVRGEEIMGKLEALQVRLEQAAKNGNVKLFNKLDAKIDSLQAKLTNKIELGMKNLDDTDPPPPEPEPELPMTILNANLADEGVNGTGHMWVGSGIPTNLAQKQVLPWGEIANIGNFRQGDFVSAYSVDQDGRVHFDLPGGTQVVDPEHNVPVANANRSAASWNYSITLDAEGPYNSWSGFLSDYKVEIKIDIDPSAAVSQIVIEMNHDPDIATGTADNFWATMFGDGSVDQIIIADDGGRNDDPDLNGLASQNSQNWAFYKAAIEAFTGETYNFDGQHNLDIVVTNRHTGDIEAWLKTAHHLGGTGLIEA